VKSISAELRRDEPADADGKAGGNKGALGGGRTGGVAQDGDDGVLTDEGAMEGGGGGVVDMVDGDCGMWSVEGDGRGKAFSSG